MNTFSADMKKNMEDLKQKNLESLEMLQKSGENLHNYMNDLTNTYQNYFKENFTRAIDYTKSIYTAQTPQEFAHIQKKWAEDCYHSSMQQCQNLKEKMMSATKEFSQPVQEFAQNMKNKFA